MSLWHNISAEDWPSLSNSALPGHNAGHEPPPLWREPPLCGPAGHGVHRDEGEAVADPDGEDHQPEVGVDGEVGGGVACTGLSSLLLARSFSLSIYVNMRQPSPMVCLTPSLSERYPPTQLSSPWSKFLAEVTNMKRA